MISNQSDYYGGLATRLGASIIDGLAVYIVSGAVENFLKLSMGASLLFSLIVGFLYYCVIQAKFKGTYGKHVMGLLVLDEDTLEPMTIKQSFKRYSMEFVSVICLGIGVLSIGWHEKHQSWHDRSAKTVVVKKEHLNELMKKVHLINSSRPL